MDEKEYLEDIKNNLSIEKIEELLVELGGEPQVNGELIKSKTICHCGDSHKLYYYNNTKLFKCYTQCEGDSFDIFELFIRHQKTKGVEVSLPQSINFIAKYFNLPLFSNNLLEEQEQLQDWKIINKYEYSNSQELEEKIVELKIYDDKILKYLPHPYIELWEKENITREVMEYDGICYDPVMQGIVIPHYNIDNKLIGIRERTLIKELEENGKYKPAILNYKMYNHPLGFNLYGLNWAKNNIKSFGKVVVFEGEKSVLLYQSYFGIENLIAVATCGSSLTSYQIDLLIEAGAKEIIIAFDRQFKEIGDNEWKNWTKKLKDIYKKYSNKIKINFIFDKWNMLDYKMSPIDNGKEIFLELFKRRFDINGKN